MNYLLNTNVDTFLNDKKIKFYGLRSALNKS